MTKVWKEILFFRIVLNFSATWWKQITKHIWEQNFKKIFVLVSSALEKNWKCGKTITLSQQKFSRFFFQGLKLSGLFKILKKFFRFSTLLISLENVWNREENMKQICSSINRKLHSFIFEFNQGLTNFEFPNVPLIKESAWEKRLRRFIIFQKIHWF